MGRMRKKEDDAEGKSKAIPFCWEWNLSTVHMHGPPSLSGKDKGIVSPCDGSDEQELPSPVGKGERARLRVGGFYTIQSITDHPSIAGK